MLQFSYRDEEIQRFSQSQITAKMTTTGGPEAYSNKLPAS